VPAPGDYGDGEIGGMIGKGNRNTLRKPAPVPLCPPPTSALAGSEWSASRPGRFITEERAPGTHWIGCWVDPRVGLDDVEKILDPTGT
jgi:hypothetical protein